MSSNLLKMGYANFQNNEMRVIDANERMARRIEGLAAEMEKFGSSDIAEDGESTGDGFQAGLSAEQMEGLFADGESESDSEDAPRSNVIKANPTQGSASAAENAERLIADARQTAEELVEQARAEAEKLLADARAQAQAERENVIASAKEQGYRDGVIRAESEYSVKERELQEQRKAMEAEYDALLDSLEPQFIDAITDVYEHLFHVEFASYREILVYLIQAAVRKIEGRDLLVHVSAEDYPYVNMEKKELIAALSSPGATLELVEDNTLRHNECMIETEGGIFDCGLGTQLAELKQKLKLLSHEAAREASHEA